MRSIKGLVAGVILAGLSLVSSPLGQLVEAESKDPAGAQSRTNAAISAATNRPQSAWRVGTPIVYENLTIFPVTTDEPTSTDDFITLDEGLRAGTVVVTELGANEPSRPIRQPGQQANNAQRQQRADSAQVNKLAITNKSGKKLVLIAGEMVTGGKQDRIVGNDEIIPSADEPVALSVFCVEHGRWSGGAVFNKDGAAASSARIMATPKVRANAQAKKDQGEVWNGVAEQVTKNKVSSATGDFKSVYQDKRVGSTLESYERAFKDKLAEKGVVGVVVAVGGRVVSADVFASPKLFQAYWPKMLKSYALEAVSAGKEGSNKVSVPAAEAFLARAGGGRLSTGKEGVYKLTEHQSDSDASFELEGHAKSSAMLVHFNRVSKK